MHMNKKAFTLIEMIAAVIILSIIATIVTVSFKNVLTKNKEKRYAEFKRELEQAACVYIDLSVNKAYKDTCYSSNKCNIKVKQLVDDGLISEKLKNPNTDEVVDQNLIIEVKWTSNSQSGPKVKSCTLK